MADGPDAAALPGIVALPPSTARQIGSGQVLVDPSSVVKELIDNALDARAKSIFVDITANTIDSIQVKDDGHGIPAEDRALVCRRYCTSKIRDFHDLKEVGGKWLGFRGEALSSMAEMSGTISVTTRVEGEPVAVKLKYGRNGELSSTERDSHPVGTTVKIGTFFQHIPVRRQTAVKSSTKWLANIRRTLQAYALARPAVRFRLRVLKAKNNQGDFVYAPKATANVEDTVLKVIGKDCALQCDWAALETDGFEVHAFLPKPAAEGSKVANYGAFVSIDARPMSNNRRTVKEVVAAVKQRLRKSNSSLGSVKDPFFCMNIICPPDSYDPNIEPAKDDVMFNNWDLVIGAVDKLLKSYYPVADVETGAIEPPTFVQHPQECEPVGPSNQDRTQISTHDDTPIELREGLISVIPQHQPHWRSSMYGIDEDDVGLLQENQPVAMEEEEGIRSAAVSNPWTIARMNAATKPKKSTFNGQLLSPAKSQSGATLVPSSPAPVATPHRAPLVEPLTPQTSSRRNMPRSLIDDELERSIQHLPQPSYGENGVASRESDLSIDLPSDAQNATYLTQADLQSPEILPPRTTQFSSPSQGMPPVASFAPRRSQGKQQSYRTKGFPSPAQALNDTWFGQPMRGSEISRPSRRQKQAKNLDIPLFTNELSPGPRRLCSENNADIRDFLSCNRGSQVHASVQSHTPIHSQGLDTALTRHSHERSSEDAEDMDAYFREREEREVPTHNSSASPPQKNAPHAAPAHESSNKTRHPRRRTTDGLERTKSSQLPLERVPCDYRIQDVMLPLTTSLVAIAESSRKLDMSCNSLEWGYSPDEALGGFVAHVNEGKIMDWVRKLDGMLQELYERMEGVDTRCALHEGIQRGLDGRKEQDRVVDTVVAPGSVLNDNHMLGKGDEEFSPGRIQQPVPEQVDDMSDFDMAQFVDLDTLVPVKTMGRVADDKDPSVVVDDFEDDIEDDMLMDL